MIFSKFFNKKNNKKTIKTLKYCNIDKTSTFKGYSTAMNFCTINNTEMGRYISIADFVSIGVEEPDFDNISTSPFLTEKSELKRTTIKNDVWIGVDSMVKNGVTVGNGAVIGSNSYVREDVPDFAIVGGNPAKVIKYRFDEETRQKILESQYWEKEPKEAKKIIDKLQKEYNLKKESR